MISNIEFGMSIAAVAGVLIVLGVVVLAMEHGDEERRKEKIGAGTGT